MTEEETAKFREDERCKALVLEVIGRRALMGGSALVDANVVRASWQEAKAAYDQVEFRKANHEAIYKRASQLARRYGQTPDLLVSTEPPVPCRLEGFQLYFFNEGRHIPIWRLFEPQAIQQVMDELKQNLAYVPITGKGVDALERRELSQDELGKLQTDAPSPVDGKR